MPEITQRFFKALNNDISTGARRLGYGTLGGAIGIAQIAGGWGSFFTGAGGLTTAGIATISVAGLGFILVGVPLAVAAYKATKGKKEREEYFKNSKNLERSDFEDPYKWDCFWTTVAIIGIRRTGKTQLKKRLLGLGVQDEYIPFYYS